MYKEIIDEAALDLAKKEKELRRQRGKGKKEYLYVSDIFQCMRKVYFSFLDEGVIEADDYTPAQIRIFHNGDAVHERICRYLKEGNVHIEEELDIPVDPDLNVHGRLDVMVYEDPEKTDKKHILELKSINLPSLSQPKREHMGQVTYYLHQMKMDTGFLIYESKVNQRIFEFQVDYDPGFAQEVMDFFRKVMDYVQKKEIPPIMYVKSRYPCSWRTGRCKFFENCWSSGIARHGPGIRRFIPDK